MVPRLWMSSWCATWWELRIHGDVELVVLLEWFLLDFTPCDYYVSDQSM